MSDEHVKMIHDPRFAQGVELGGRRVRVGWAQKNTSLYVTGLEAGGTITTEMLVREFARFGPLDKELTAIKPGGKYRTLREYAKAVPRRHTPPRHSFFIFRA